MPNVDAMTDFIKQKFSLSRKVDLKIDHSKEETKKWKRKAPLQKMDEKLDDLSFCINKENERKNADFLKEGNKVPISPRYKGRVGGIFHVQNKFSRWWRFREWLKKPYRFFGNLILLIVNFDRKLAGKEPWVLVPANRSSVTNYENAMPFHSFENLAQFGKKAEIRHQGYGTDLQKVLQSKNGNFASEKLFLSNAPAICTVNDEVKQDDDLLNAFKLIHQYLENNSGMSFKKLKQNFENVQLTLQDIKNDENNPIGKMSGDPVMQGKIQRILQGRYHHARHPLTNFASYMYAVSQNGENPVYHNDILTADCKLIAENDRPIYFVSENNKLICFDPNDCLNRKKNGKVNAKILPQRTHDGKKHIEQEDSVGVHEVVHKDKHGNVLTAAVHGGFMVYGETKRETPYHLLMHLGYQDNVRFTYDKQFPEAFAAARQAMRRMQVEDSLLPSDEKWQKFYEVIVQCHNQRNDTDSPDHEDKLNSFKNIANIFGKDTSKLHKEDDCSAIHPELYLLFDDLLKEEWPIEFEQFKALCYKKMHTKFSAGGQKSSVLFNCMAGSNRSQLIMTQYVLKRFVENIYHKYLEKHTAETVNLEEFMQGVQNHINDNPYQTIFQMAECVGLETQASQMSQFGYDNNGFQALVCTKGLSPMMKEVQEGIKEQFVQNYTKKTNHIDALRDRSRSTISSMYRIG